ncbi:C4-dicarboxylate ABC transporter [Acinetobacter sp. ANC 5054]|uniref:TDT family transporter n=1 Tax=Acinetobacter sp. ANC 5054 TaxID=1977877 RepID=UPI000A333712|nr:TDT family transporter [Acinetobacter sp. ANC 5054]OTG84609.1 C4-dicarboxylate ABC transporter [Acinetobacter sp. ANC 5054]
MKMPFYQLQHKQDLIRHFTPNWFTVVMGTGVVALILPELPFGAVWMWSLGASLWQVNVAVFILFSVLYICRWILFPKEAKQIFQHPVMCLFLGAIPMALATLLNGALKFGSDLYGVSYQADILRWVEYLWYVDVGMAVAIAWLVPFFMFSRQQHALEGMTAVWLLPIVACEVAASSAALLLVHLPTDAHAVNILLGSYVLWGMSVLPAFAILTILLLRLALHQLPSKDMAISSWLALGPIGTGALALLLLGEQAPRILGAIDMASLGTILEQGGLVVALILLGFGLWWLGIAILTTLKHLRDLPFNLGWWAMTFPLGVFTLAVMKLAAQTQLESIAMCGNVFALLLCALWFMVISKTLLGCYRGSLFFSPCLKAYRETLRTQP